jgi:hypothetical protein
MGNNIFSSISGTSWQSEEYSVKKSEGAVAIQVGATGVDTNSTLDVEIFVDGKSVKKGNSKGEMLVTQVSYIF